MDRTRGVRVAVGDWQRVLTDSVTARHGLTGYFSTRRTPRAQWTTRPVGGRNLPTDKCVAWCTRNSNDKRLRIVLCGHAGEHDSLLQDGVGTRGHGRRARLRGHR